MEDDLTVSQLVELLEAGAGGDGSPADYTKFCEQWPKVKPVIEKIRPYLEQKYPFFGGLVIDAVINGGNYVCKH